MAVLQNIANLVGWYRAAAIGVSLNGQNLVNGNGAPQFWPDISGKGNNLTFPGNDVVFRTNVLNGKPVVQFNSGAGSSYAQGPGTSVYFTSVTAWTALVVFRIDALNAAAAGSVETNPSPFGFGPFGGAAGGNNFGMACIPGSTNEFQAWVGANGAPFSQQPLVVGNWYLMVFGSTTGPFTAWGYNNWYQNATVAASLNALASTSTLILGATPIGSGTVSPYCKCSIAEVLLYNIWLGAQAGPPNLLAQSYNYLAAEYFGLNTAGAVAPVARADVLEMARDRLSRQTWHNRRLIANPVSVVVPPQYADDDIFDDLWMQNPHGPDVSGQGAGWPREITGHTAQARQVRIIGKEIDDDKIQIALTLSDQRLISYHNVDSLTGIRADGRMRQGELVLSQNMYRQFIRLSQAWAPQPLNGLVANVPTSYEKMSGSGTLLESIYQGQNYILRNSFVSGSTGLTLAPNAGGSIAAGTPTFPVFDASVTTNCIAFHMGTGAADCDCTFPLTTTISTNTARVFIDYWNNVQTAQLAWRLKATSTGLYWNDSTQTWGASHNNLLPLSAVGAFSSFASNVLTGVVATTYTLEVFFPNGSASGATAELYYVELFQPGATENMYRRTRIVNDNVLSLGTNGANPDILILSDPVNSMLVVPGGCRWRFTPQWSAADITQSGLNTGFAPFANQKQMVLAMIGGADFNSNVNTTTGWGHYLLLRFNATTGNLELIVNNATSAYSPLTLTMPWSPVAGTTYKFGIRITSPNGELGKLPNTVSLFYASGASSQLQNVAEGQLSAALAAAALDPVSFSDVQAYLGSGGGNLSLLVTDTCGGIVQCWESDLICRTDQEYASW